jgi:CPA2 family monovalent cation:H+ antiporter-2
MLDPLLMQLVLASMVISMLLAPFIIANSDAIVLKLSANEWMMQSLALTQIATRTMSTQKHVIIAGFGRSGQNLAKLLEEEGIAYQALDLDPDRVRSAQAAGAQVSYGDAARRESLKAAGIQRAAAMVITYADTQAAVKTLHFAHEIAPSLPVIVRSHDDSDLDKLRKAGATEVVPEALEGSLMLASHALVMMGVPLRRVVHRVQAARDERYASLRGYFHGVGDDDDEEEQTRLHSVPVNEAAKAIGKTIASLGLEELGAEAIAIRRGKASIEASGATTLQAGDIVVLRGPTEAVARAEARLLK